MAAPLAAGAVKLGIPESCESIRLLSLPGFAQQRTPQELLFVLSKSF
jgi:hypothetical protein